MRPPRSARHAARVGAIAASLLVAPPVSAQPTDLSGPPPHPIVVGADRDYPPYEFLDRDGQPAGYNVDLTRAIAEVMGMPVEFRFGGWSEIRAGLMSGEIDVLQGISWSERRAGELDFAPPHAIVHHAVFARRGGRRVRSLEELRGSKVIVFGGGIMDEELSRLGLGPDLVRTATPADALRRLASGQDDYVALALLPGIYITRELKLSNVVPVAENVAAERYGFAVRRGNTELLARFNEGLAILKRTGRYEEIHARWLGVLEPRGVAWATVVKVAALVLVPLVVVLGGTLLWSRSLQRLVAQRTESLALEVAERKRSEEQLRLHQQQLVQADKMAALGVLVAGVAHEINNPNGFIMLNLGMLKAALEDALPVLDARAAADGDFELGGVPYSRMREELPRLVDDMLAGGRRIKRIVDDLKDFARREDAPRLEPVDVNGAVLAAVRLVEPAVRRATGRFLVELAPELPPVLGNAQRVEQVIVNLLVNACQAVPDRSRAIRVATRRDEAAGEVVVEVADEGVGIPPEHLSRLTEPFFTTKRDAGGTGLGLSVSAAIVKEHGARLHFASQLGAGTTATVAFPPAPEGRS